MLKTKTAEIFNKVTKGRAVFKFVVNMLSLHFSS